ncbi:MAG: winged helix-turn-helix domain-containing protein [Promethearchaeota archaeon]
MDTSTPEDRAPRPWDFHKESPADAALFRCLGNPIRRQLLRFMLECEKTSYTELRDTFQLEPGTLYFHLEQLMSPEAPLLHQTADRQYEITPLGRVAATFLNQASEITPTAIPPSSSARHPQLRRATYYLGFAPIFRYLTSRLDHLVIEALIIVTGLSALFVFLPTLMVGFIPIQLPFLPALFAIFSFVGSWLLSTGGTELILRIRDHNTEGFPALLIATLYAWLPLALFVVLTYLFIPFEGLFIIVQGMLLFATLMWTLWIYMQAIMYTKRVGLRKAGLISIVLTLVTLLLTLYIAPTIP